MSPEDLFYHDMAPSTGHILAEHGEEEEKNDENDHPDEQDPGPPPPPLYFSSGNGYPACISIHRLQEKVFVIGP